jgi:LEA14-like dessication related protein
MKKYLIFIFCAFFASGCASFRDAADVREPDVRFQNMSVQQITFDGVTLLFDFEVTNPNRFSVSAEQYSYEFFINDESFIRGLQEEPLRIERESTDLIQVPVSLTFSEVYRTFGSVLRQDRLSYQLTTEVEFDLAVVGRQRVPVETSGHIPLPRMPRVDFGDINVKELSFSGADVEVSFRVRNPNPFSIAVSQVDYLLKVNGREWLDSTLDEEIRVEGSESREVRIPLRLSTTQLGSAMMDIMSGNSTFQYDLTGSAEISADLEGFPSGQLFPFELSGEYEMD